MTINIAILDYGVGNLRSLTQAFHRHPTEQVNVKVTASSKDLCSCDLMVLPGVGSFPQAMRSIKTQGLFDLINQLVIRERKPTLGICLGMQLFFENSLEGGSQPGLGWIKGKVTKIPRRENCKVPHIGWNRITSSGTFLTSSLQDVPFYFVHSYRVECPEQFVLGTAEYGEEIVAAVAHENLVGLQFHPEKSGKKGIALISSILNWVSDCKRKPQ